MLKHLSLSLQMMASQQAQARAATVKSAAEMAAARAAEISKQLKGNDPEGVEEKRSPDRYFSVQYIFHLGSVVGMCVWTIIVSMLADMSRHQIFFLASPSPIFFWKCFFHSTGKEAYVNGICRLRRWSGLVVNHKCGKLAPVI